MAADRRGKSTIVIKKIYVTSGHHGGAWKVALADFMTAMMAFFMVMWLLGQNEETKSKIAEHFSTPSIVEYNFRHYGALITLEKLFLDFVNSPLEAVYSLLEPVDKAPNLLDFGSEAIANAYLKDQLQDLLDSPNLLKMEEDGMQFTLLDTHFFQKGSAQISPNFVQSAEKLKGVTKGLKDAVVTIEMQLFHESVPDSDPVVARDVAIERLQILVHNIKSSLEETSVEIRGQIKVTKKVDYVPGAIRPNGLIVVDLKQLEMKEDGTSYRKLERVFKKTKTSESVYQDFVNKITDPQSLEK
jgi:chemotaxis protein MotB